MSFDVSADAYTRFMGRYSEPLAARFADLAGVRPGQRALDVGCGPGALTAELADRLGAGEVCAVDPSESFAAAARERLPGSTVGVAAAERLPFPDRTFDAALAQLVVHFMADPVAGLREMGRVTRAGGVVGACVWDHGGAHGPLSFVLAGRARAGSVSARRIGAGRRRRGPARRALRAGRAGRGGRHHADGPGLLRHVRPVVAALHARRRPGRGLRGVADHAAAPPAARTLPGAAGRGPDSTSARPRGRSPAAADPPRDHRLRRNAFAIGADASAPTPPPSTSTAKARSPR